MPDSALAPSTKPERPLYVVRSYRFVSALALVVISYWVYAIVSVPLIEPEARRPTPRERGIDRHFTSQAVASQRAELRRWFKPGDWELTSPKVLETPQGQLLFKDYQTLDDGKRVRIEPCTMVFLPQGPFKNEAERSRRAILLRAIDGAILEFDEVFDLRRGKIGKLIGGDLTGPVTIHSQQRSAGAEDDLRIETRDVRVSPTLITTPHRLHFWLGGNRGQGRRLRIEISDQARLARSQAGSANFGGVTSFELTEEVRLLLAPSDADLFPGEAVADDGNEKVPGQPVQVRCRGPFRFEVEESVATFADDVNVVRANPDGPSDEINCELLSVYFDVQPNDPAGAAPATPRLSPSRLSASGNPVVIRAPSNGFKASGQRLEYDLKTRAGNLQGVPEAQFQQDRGTDGVQEIHAPSLDFKPGLPGEPGTFLAKGKGWLVSPGSEAVKGGLEARWTMSLHFRPHENEYALSIKGGALVRSPETGTLRAGELHLWLAPPIQRSAEPKSAQSPSLGGLIPKRLLARGTVRMDSPKLVGTVKELQLWFPVPEPASDQPSAAGSIAAPPVAPDDNTPSNDALAGRMRIEGDLLQAQLAVEGGQMAVSEVVVDGHVNCSEDDIPASAIKDMAPFVIAGDRMHMVRGPSGAANVTIDGQPARMDGRGLKLAGGSDEQAGRINLSQAQNKVWVSGAGQMEMPVANDLSGQPLETAQPMTVEWQGKMEFDGQTAWFEQLVEARSRHQWLRTRSLRVGLTRAVQLGKGGSDMRPDVQVIACRGGVFLEQHSYDNRKLIRTDRLQAHDLNVNRLEDTWTALGPGWVQSTGYFSQENSGGLFGQTKNSAASAAANASSPRSPIPSPRSTQLTYLGIDFDRQVSGEIIRRVTRFEGRVRAVYGPVADWEAQLDPNRPEWLGGEGFAMNCDQLTVSQMSPAGSEDAPYDLEASGNTVVEGALFTARSQRLTYAMAKDLLVLEGDGRSEAELFRRASPEAADDRLAGGRILYWPKTQRGRVSDGSSLDLNDLTGLRRRVGAN